MSWDPILKKNLLKSLLKCRHAFFFSLFITIQTNIKSDLKAILMIAEKGLIVRRKKLDCLKMKMCKGVHLRMMKIKGFVHRWQMREKTIPTFLSSKHEVCFMTKSAFKVMDTLLVVP